MPRRRNTARDVWRRILVGNDTECWPYDGALSTTGYGQFFFDGRLHTAHRVTYELVHGPIPDGLYLDHLCRNRACCNPAHLEPVTARENVQRSPVHNGAKTHCPKGHPYDGDNLRVYRGGRFCRECMRIDSCKRKRRKRAEYASRGLTARGTRRIRRPQTARDGGPGCPGAVDQAAHH